ncbi:hypothetical protein HMPREF1548_05017 [Clostridium sp. KLE 1755]|nr:hypothetical protein HMPREF1548_05017 [Clostridium sp. KLE 1755]
MCTFSPKKYYPTFFHNNEYYIDYLFILHYNEIYTKSQYN